eukprot:CAMPEP_0177673282 /NCGR_PEP_ID=MMETSP0447-20121125/25848_1 /TAXON_ID=0 /ORGANISM="Stygamoeba regulata, Strain BSH-02190019" /LENGTH=43 /DNA_ID= /DNA_START= /DNA_END= /DNA_ORIENTATION=
MAAGHTHAAPIADGAVWLAAVRSMCARPPPLSSSTSAEHSAWL